MEGCETAFVPATASAFLLTRRPRFFCNAFIGKKVLPAVGREVDRNVVHIHKRFPTACGEPISTPTSVKKDEECADSREIIELFWKRTNEGRFVSMVDLFTEDAVYYDTLYPSPFKGKAEITRHMRNMEEAMPVKRMNFILDDIAVSVDKVGARWHVESKTGSPIPFSRGASMYSLVRTESGILISEAWDFPETPIKAAGVILPLLRFVSGIFK